MAHSTSDPLEEGTAISYAECLRKSKGNPNEKSIYFYGGEPILYWRQICTLLTRLAQIDSYYTQVNYIIFTNGLVPIRDISSFPLLRQLQVRISWSSVTKSDQPLALGMRFREFGASVFFNVTIDTEEVDRYKKIITHLQQLSFPMLLNPLRGEALRSHLSTPDKFAIYISVLKELYKFCLEQDVKEARVEGLRRAISLHQPVEKDCYLNGGRQIIVLPDGKFSVCFDDLAVNGQAYQSGEITALGNLVTDYYQAADTECQRCEWQNFCSGGCARQNREETTGKWERDRVICEITKFLCKRVTV